MNGFVYSIILLLLVNDNSWAVLVLWVVIWLITHISVTYKLELPSLDEISDIILADSSEINAYTMMLGSVL